MKGAVVSSSISNLICCNEKQCSGIYHLCMYVCMYGERSHLINETFGWSSGREEGREEGREREGRRERGGEGAS